MGKQFVTISNIVDDVLNDLGIYTEENYIRYKQFVIRGVTNINLFHLNSTKQVTLPVSQIGTVNLPDDFIDYTYIGICYEGNEWSLTRNDHMCIPEDGACSVEQGNPDNDEVIPSIGTYGASGGYNSAYYKIDKLRNRIVLQGSTSGADIKLTYISNGIDYNNETLLPLVARESLIAWTHWKAVQHDSAVPYTIKADNKEEYFREVTKLRMLEYSFTIDELKDAYYSGLKQTPKR